MRGPWHLYYCVGAYITISLRSFEARNAIFLLALILMARDAYTDLACELRGCTGHEAGHLLMSHLNEFDVALGSRKRTDQPANSVTRIAECTAYAPGLQPLPDEVSDRLRHRTHTKIGMP